MKEAGELKCMPNPIYYIWRKWIWRRKRTVRYGANNDQIEKYDERRIIDARFWLFFGNVSNLIFQVMTSSRKEPQGIYQPRVNFFYFISSAFQFTCLGMSFYHSFNWIIVGLICFTIRNILPLYDLEKRKENIDNQEWFILILIQSITTVLNSLLLTNVMDRGFTPLIILTTIFWVQGIYFALIKGDALMTVA